MNKLAVLLPFAILSAGEDRPEFADLLRQGSTLVATGQLSAARAAHEQSQSSSQSAADISFEQGMVYFRQQNWKQAAECYKRSLESRPGAVKPLYYLAQAYYMDSNLDLARETIRQAAALAPGDPQVCQKYGEYLTLSPATRKESLLWLQRARDLLPGLPRIDFDIGKAQLELGDVTSAAASFEIAVRKDSGDGQAAFYLAECQAQSGDVGAARRNYESALAHGYVNGPVYYGLGRVLVRAGQPTAAVAALRRAAAIQPSLIEVHFQLAIAYRQLGQNDEARRETRLFGAMANRVDEAEELKGPEERSAWNLVRDLAQANKESAALEELAKMPASGASCRRQAEYLLGVVYYGLGRNDAAIRLLKLASKQRPDCSRITAYLGVVQLHSGEVSAAAESFRTALDRDSSEFLALVGAGRIRYEQKRWAEAVDYFERSRTADPGTLLALCDAYLRLHRTEDAMLTAEVIRAFGSGNQALLQSLDDLISSPTAPRR